MAARTLLNTTPLNQKCNVWETMFELRNARAALDYHQRYVAGTSDDHGDSIVAAAYVNETEANAAITLMEAFRSMTLYFDEEEDE